LKPWVSCTDRFYNPFVSGDFHAVGILCSLSAENDPFRVGGCTAFYMRKLDQAAPVHIFLRWDNAHTKNGGIIYSRA